MNTTKFIWKRWLRAGLVLLFATVLCWHQISAAGRIFFLIATPCSLAAAFYFWRIDYGQQRKQQKTRKLERENRPTKRNPPAILPPLRK
ncbi:MAG: hypothetical protein P4N60_10180 [Verrucomicrobiae bacterium]|nr:hypothetical protein [Verrucomicrobiae bacterium]